MDVFWKLFHRFQWFSIYRGPDPRLARCHQNHPKLGKHIYFEASVSKPCFCFSSFSQFLTKSSKVTMCSKLFIVLEMKVEEMTMLSQLVRLFHKFSIYRGPDPRLARCHQNNQKQGTHNYFEAKVPKPWLLPSLSNFFGQKATKYMVAPTPRARFCIQLIPIALTCPDTFLIFTRQWLENKSPDMNLAMQLTT